MAGGAFPAMYEVAKRSVESQEHGWTAALPVLILGVCFLVVMVSVLIDEYKVK
jgi:hypothetical protein